DFGGSVPVAKYVPSPRDWVREQVELYENSGGTKGTTLRDTGLPVVLVTHWGNKTGAIRKTSLMRVKDGDNYVLIGSQGGGPKDPAWDGSADCNDEQRQPAQEHLAHGIVFPHQCSAACAPQIRWGRL